jgi:hypothetical protein
LRKRPIAFHITVFDELGFSARPSLPLGTANGAFWWLPGAPTGRNSPGKIVTANRKTQLDNTFLEDWHLDRQATLD